MHFERHFDLSLAASDMQFIQKISWGGGALGMMHSFEQLSNYKLLNGGLWEFLFTIIR